MVVADLSLLELFEEVLILLKTRVGCHVLRVEHLIHDELELLLSLPDRCRLRFHLGLQLLVLDKHLVHLLFQVYLFFVEPLLIGVLHALRNVCALIQILLGLLIREIRNALQVLGGLQLVTRGRLRSRAPTLSKAAGLLLSAAVRAFGLWRKHQIVDLRLIRERYVVDLMVLRAARGQQRVEPPLRAQVGLEARGLAANCGRARSHGADAKWT